MLWAVPINAQNGGLPGLELAARAGYDGYYKSDQWVPVRVSAANEGEAVQGYLQIVTGDTGSNDQVVFRSPISLPTSSNKVQTLYVQLPSLVRELTVELVDEADRVLAMTKSNRMTGLAADSLLYAVVTRVPGQLEYLENVTGGRSEAAVGYLTLEELPEAAVALNAIDVAIFDDMDTGQLTSGQREALESWLDTGGTVVVTGGAAWQERTAGLVDLLPVTISGTQTLDDIPALRAAGDVAFRDPGPYLVADSSLRGGETLIHQDGLPLVARQGHGRGSVFFLALDPALAPLRDWDGSEAVWTEMVGYARPLPDWANGVRQSFAATNAVSSLPASDLPTAWALLIFLVLYVLIVGPVNYLVLRRLGRRELAWLTIPLLVVIFTMSAYLVGFRLKGNETIVNQMSIVYGQSNGDRARVQTLIGLYSPRRASYDLSVPAEAFPRPFSRTSMGLGGQDNIEAIEQGETTAVTGIRVDVGGVETLVADSYQALPDVTGSVRLQPSGDDVVLDINVNNNGATLLENATLLVGSMAIPLGDLAPASNVSHVERVTSPAVSLPRSGPIGATMPASPMTSPLLANLDTILGSTNYYNDRQIYPRWQLLQAMAPQYGLSSNTLASSAFTLVAWSDEPQLALGLGDKAHDSTATSLYFLELPASSVFADSAEVVVPRAFLDWTVLAENGAYNADIADLYLPQGSVEYEFRPWSEFKSLQIESLALVIEPPAGVPAQRLPQVGLWDWDSEEWLTPADAAWGHFAIDDHARYVGPGNAIRLRLINHGPEGISIQYVYPELRGVTK